MTIFNDPANTRVYRGLTSGPNGNLWATTNEYNTIVEFNPSGQLVATFPVSGSPYALTEGPDGNLWYDENAANNIGRITPQGAVTEFPIPTPSSGAEPPIAGPDGNIWFAEYNTDKVGEVVLSPNRPGNGVNIDGAPGNIIGGTTAAARNIISGDAIDGIEISGTNATGNAVEGNLIGTTVAGAPALPNGSGVVIDSGASCNTIGGDFAGAGNVISGNTNDGIELNGAGTSGNIVSDDYIGTDSTGTYAVPNQVGVEIDGGASGNLIGTNGDGVDDALERNIISGNTFAGVWILGAETVQNGIAGNYIGTNCTGTVAVGNGVGVNLGDGSNNRVGVDGQDTDPADELNIISGNGTGIDLDDSSGDVVAGNYIGISDTLTTPGAAL